MDTPPKVRCCPKKLTVSLQSTGRTTPLVVEAPPGRGMPFHCENVGGRIRRSSGAHLNGIDGKRNGIEGVSIRRLTHHGRKGDHKVTMVSRPKVTSEGQGRMDSSLTTSKASLTSQLLPTQTRTHHCRWHLRQNSGHFSSASIHFNVAHSVAVCVIDAGAIAVQEFFRIDARSIIRGCEESVACEARCIQGKF